MDVEEKGVVGPCFGHAGDGNLIDTTREGLNGGSFPPGIRAVEVTANLRCQLWSLPYGDSFFAYPPPYLTTWVDIHINVSWKTMNLSPCFESAPPCSQHWVSRKKRSKLSRDHQLSAHHVDGKCAVSCFVLIRIPGW
jgi:hypothetical protein